MAIHRPKKNFGAPAVNALKAGQYPFPPGAESRMKPEIGSGALCALAYACARKVACIEPPFENVWSKILDSVLLFAFTVSITDMTGESEAI